MAEVFGTASFSAGTGQKLISLGITPTSMEVWVGAKSGGDTYFHESYGRVVGGVQKAVTKTGSSIDEPVNAKIIRHKDSSGTIIFEANWVSFPTGQVEFNVTISPANVYPILIYARN